MESLDHFGKNLRAHREAADLTQTEVAETLGVGNVYICQLESGLRKPSAKLLFNVAALLNCSVADLLQPTTKGKGKK